MINPYSRPDFRTTKEYIRTCLDGAKVPHTDYIVLTGKTHEGDLYITMVEKSGFRFAGQGMVTCMLRFLLMLLTDKAELSDCDEDSIIAMTNHLCISRNWYTDLYYSEISPEEFREESRHWFPDFAKYFAKNPPEETGRHPHGNYGYFKNYQPVENFVNNDPLSCEHILKVYSLVNLCDGKYFFVITETHYMVVNWHSGGPLHLLIKPDQRTPGTQMISRDVFFKLFPKEETGN